MTATVRTPGEVLEEAEILEQEVIMETETTTVKKSGVTVSGLLRFVLVSVLVGVAFYAAGAYMAEHVTHVFGDFYIMH